MVQFLITYWYLFLIVFALLVVIITLLIQEKVKKIWRNLSNRAPLIKKYWRFVIFFLIIILLFYFVITRYSSSDNLQVNLTLLGQGTTLIFAIFVGYFAFLQVIENRFEKTKEQAHFYFKGRLYLRARQYYEQAHIIKPKDFSVLGELLEIYLIVEDYEKFEEKLKLLEKIVMEKREKVVWHYLGAAEFLIKQHSREARKEIRKSVQFIKDNFPVLEHGIWNFSDIKRADVYVNLSGEIKKIFKNFIFYLANELDESKRKKFEDGDYTLEGVDSTS